MASDEVTIDVGPVWCPSCKREFGSTERDAEVSALRAALERIDRFAKVPWSGPYCRWCGWVDERHRPTCPTAIARDALGRYPKEASDG